MRTHVDIIDLHVHVVPEGLPDGGPTPPGSFVREATGLDRVVAEHRAAGTSHLLICPWVALLPQTVADGDQDRRAARTLNRAMAAAAGPHRADVSALGALALGDPAVAAQDLGQLAADGALAGVELPASVAGTSLGDARFAPLWEAAEETGLIVFVHPTTGGLGLPALADHYLWNSVGNPLETTIFAAQMIASGVLDRHPDLRIVLAHGGGALVALAGRLSAAHRRRPEARAGGASPPRELLSRFFYDSLTHDAVALRALVTAVGAERVVLGSDSPFDMGDADPAAAVRALALAPADEAAILHGNARRLLGLPAMTGTVR